MHRFFEHKYTLFAIVVVAGIILAACAPSQALPAATNTSIPVTPSPTPCVPPPIVVPTPPAEIPGYTELDPSTGLHMTGTPQEIDLETYRLEITGNIDNPLSLTYDDLRCMPKVETRCTLVCPGFFQDEATWAGASLEYILDQAQVHPDAEALRLVSADGYSAVVYLEDARSELNFVAYEWEGEPLPILHGFPVRAVFPELNGNEWIKWLVEIEVL